MDTKLFELRDEGTCIPVIATRMESQQPRERWLLQRAGYSLEAPFLVLLARADGGERGAHYDPYDWGGRTYPVAHEWLAQHWDEVKSGALIDVRYILGETAAPCESDQPAA